MTTRALDYLNLSRYVRTKTASEKQLLMFFASVADKDGCSHYSVPAISWFTLMPERSVNRAKKALQVLGVLSWQRRGNRYSHVENLYRLDINTIRQLSSAGKKELASAKAAHRVAKDSEQPKTDNGQNSTMLNIDDGHGNLLDGQKEIDNGQTGVLDGQNSSTELYHIGTVPIVGTVPLDGTVGERIPDGMNGLDSQEENVTESAPSSGQQIAAEGQSAGDATPPPVPNPPSPSEPTAQYAEEQEVMTKTELLERQIDDAAHKRDKYRAEAESLRAKGKEKIATALDKLATSKDRELGQLMGQLAAAQCVEIAEAGPF